MYFQMAALAMLVVFTGCQRERGPTAGDRPPPAPQAELTVGYIHQLDGAPTDAPLEVPVEAGQLVIDEAYLVVSAVEFHLCEASTTTGDAGAWRQIEDMLIPAAQAHVAGTALRLGTPWVEDLLAAPGKARIVGEVAPPLGRVCRVVAVIAPADDDVMNLSSLPVEDIVGKSLLVRGRRRASPAAAWTHFELSTDATRLAELPAVDPQTGQAPMVLSEPGASRMILLDKTVTPALFAAAADDDAPALLDALADALTLHTFPSAE